MLRGPLRFTNAGGGTADFVYPGPVIDLQSPASAGALNGLTYTYYAERFDRAQWEIGQGVYTSSSGTFARTAVIANSLGTTAKINFGSAPQIMVFDGALGRTAYPGVNFYVSPSGDDTHDGLTPGTAVKTIARAASLLYTTVDCQNAMPTINLAAGTYTETVTLQGQLTGFNFVRIQGAGSGVTTWKPGAGGSCLIFGDNAEVQLRAMTLDNTGGANDCSGISGHQIFVVDVLDDMVFGTFPGSVSAHINADAGGFINLPADYTIAGRAAWHINFGIGTVVTQAAAVGHNIVFSGTFTIDVMYRSVLGGRMQFSTAAHYTTGTATVSSAYAVDFGTMISLQSTAFPGAWGAGTGNGVHGAVVA